MVLSGFILIVFTRLIAFVHLSNGSPLFNTSGCARFVIPFKGTKKQHQFGYLVKLFMLVYIPEGSAYIIVFEVQQSL